jgi:hypothetical protein
VEPTVDRDQLQGREHVVDQGDGTIDAQPSPSDGDRFSDDVAMRDQVVGGVRDERVPDAR